MYLKSIIAMILCTAASIYSMETSHIQEVDGQWLLAKMHEYKKHIKDKQNRDSEVVRLHAKHLNQKQDVISRRVGIVHGNSLAK